MPNNKKRGEEALSHLERELKSRERKEKTRPLGVVLASVVVILALVGGIFFMATRDSEEQVVAEDQATPSESAGAEQMPEATALSLARNEALPATVTCEYTPDGQEAGVQAPNGSNVSTEGVVNASLETNQGPIGLELDRAVAPCAVNSMEHLINEGFYDDTVCHRLTSSGIFVLQCGDPNAVGGGAQGDGMGGPGYGFATEYPYDEKGDDAAATVIYPKGTIAMARAQDPNSNGSQFFLNYEDSTLPPDYTYFGKINEEGMETLAKVAEIGVAGGQPDGAPAEEIKIETASVQ